MDQLRCFGCSRVGDAPKSLDFHFNRAPTTDEMRWLLDLIQRGAALYEPEAPKTPPLRLIREDK